VVRLKGAGQEGVGEDVTPFEPAQLGFSRSEGELPVAGRWSVDSFAEHLEGLKLYPDGLLPPNFPTTFRRWAFESALLDLGLRQSGVSLQATLGRTPHPVEFVNSPMLGKTPSVAAAGQTRSAGCVHGPSTRFGQAGPAELEMIMRVRFLPWP